MSVLKLSIEPEHLSNIRSLSSQTRGAGGPCEEHVRAFTVLAFSRTYHDTMTMIPSTIQPNSYEIARKGTVDHAFHS